MTLRRYANLTAWLGLIAMWLIVCAPLVSQLVIASHEREPVAALCSAAASPDVAHQDSTSHSLSACGYCDLLASHAAMPSLPAAVVPVLTLIVIMTAPVLSVRFTPLGAFPSGRPRAPPLFS